ncbi:uncharacterized protein CEXT_561501 [Caerostris extrusa]|uniref:Transposase n=1 Tax=Caerostris extrusa TaxID=172846 RepID=A0AAV4TKB5_CAEEX|nr:uncharacterized protein CEXT_561501 [Caerostris extrusa]
MPVSTVHKILRNILHCYSYKITHVQDLHTTDLPVRHAFALKFLTFVEVDNRWPCLLTRPISLSRLCQYTKLQDMGNGKSIRNWTSTASFCKGHCVVLVDGIVYSRTIVFRGCRSCGSCYLYVNGKRYESLLRNQAIPTLNQCACGNRIIFMQDGALPHIAKTVMQLIKRPFGNDRIIRTIIVVIFVVILFSFIFVNLACKITGPQSLRHLAVGLSKKMLYSVDRLQI